MKRIEEVKEFFKKHKKLKAPQSYIANELNIKRTNLCKYIKELKDKGIIEVIPSNSENGYFINGINTYIYKGD